MDYIERDALLLDCTRRYCEDCGRRKGMKNGKMKTVYAIGDAPCRACWVDDMMGDIEDFPAADVKPVVRGEWVKDNDGIDICSECASIALQRVHIKLPEKIVDLRMVRSRFCPNCGAEMVTDCHQLEEGEG